MDGYLKLVILFLDVEYLRVLVKRIIKYCVP